MTESSASKFPVHLVCPLCQGELQFGSSRIICSGCAEEYVYEGGFPNLIRGGEFPDEWLPERIEYEALAASHLAADYWIPTFRRLLAGTTGRPRVLSLGCGAGKDVDLLAAADFDVVGIDCGTRCKAWSQREQKNRFFGANGKHLPFKNESFDLVYCGCVFPHVGVEGDSRKVLPNYFEERLAIAREMTRVLRPDGSIVVSSPNRLFPLDIFHGRTPAHPYPHINPPTSRFLLSRNDYWKLFRASGCTMFRLLPVSGYWPFLNKRKTWQGRLVVLPLRAVFDLVSRRHFRFLRGSLISPWLVGLARKRGLDNYNKYLEV